MKKCSQKYQNKSCLIYVSGGCRSGKSSYAQKLAEKSGTKKTYLATCPVIDAEMDRRIAVHQQERIGGNWQTIEEPLDLVKALQHIADRDVVLIDCLTLWVNNLMYQAEQDGREPSEKDMSGLCSEVITACRETGCTVIVVSNEVGMGVVPGDAVSRLYRDLIGRCNQAFATAADEAFFMVSGLPIKLK
jgi:adenosylcobinamide kinase/adenosylcobinamide-phosphate guanylyltransferase